MPHTQMGFTNRNQLHAQAVQDMAAQAERIVILTESKKFAARGVVPLRIESKPNTIITDIQIDAAARTELQSKGIIVETV